MVSTQDTLVMLNSGDFSVSRELDFKRFLDLDWSHDELYVAFATSITNNAHQGEILVYNTETWETVATLYGAGKSGFWKDPSKAVGFSLSDGMSVCRDSDVTQDEKYRQAQQLLEEE